MKGIKRKIDTTGRITIPAVLRQVIGVNKGDTGTWKITDNGNLLLEFNSDEEGSMISEEDVV